MAALSAAAADPSRLEAVLRQHEHTKHRFYRFAAGHGGNGVMAALKELTAFDPHQTVGILQSRRSIDQVTRQPRSAD